MEFYRHVLCVKCPTKLFNKTKVGNNGKRVKLLWTELFENLKTMIKINSLPENYTIVKIMLKNRSDRDIVFISEKKELMKKIKHARLKRVCDQQIKGILPEFLSDPQLLVGKIIQHHVVEDCDNEFWEKVEVLRIFKTNIDTKRIISR